MCKSGEALLWKVPFSLWYQDCVWCVCVSVCVRAQFKVTSSLRLWDAGTTLVQTRCPSHVLQLHDEGAKPSPFASNITVHQYLITAGTNHEINSWNGEPAQWHVWLCVDTSALCMNDSLPTSPMQPPSYCSHLAAAPSDTPTNLSVIKDFIKVEGTPVLDTLWLISGILPENLTWPDLSASRVDTGCVPVV